MVVAIFCRSPFGGIIFGVVHRLEGPAVGFGGVQVST
jgi:hypothetical protein